MLKTVGTGVRLSPERMHKLAQLAQALSVSRNEAVGLLIEAAQVIHRPSISVLCHADGGVATYQMEGVNDYV